jgi:ParB-like chromosome segregation protein Spo0J
VTVVSSSSALTVEQVPLDQLRPDPANPRRISDEELDSLERSLRQFGFVQPVLARREDGTVIGGHQRLVAARRLGLKTVPVTYVDISVEQARLLSLALNRISGAWDEQVKRTQALADMAVRLAELDGVPAAAPADPEALARRTTELVADLVEPAKADALEKLGEGRQALGIAVSWLRPKFIVIPAPVPDTRSL